MPVRVTQYVPSNAIYWLFDEGAGAYADSNTGTANTRVILDAYGMWGTGRYGASLALDTHSYPAYLGHIADADDGVPVDGCMALFIAYWFWQGDPAYWANGLFSPEGFRNYQRAARIGVPWRCEGEYGRADRGLGTGWINYGAWQHLAFAIWVESGKVHCKTYVDGALCDAFLNAHDADTIGPWGAGNTNVGSGASTPSPEQVRIDEMVIVPGWIPTDDEIADLVATQTLQPRSIIPMAI